MKARSVVLAVLVAATTLVLPAVADDGDEPQGRDPVTEQEITDRLGEISLDAVPVFEQATRALDTGDFAAARAGYLEVLSLAPEFPDALRRLSHVERSLGDVTAAVQYGYRAFTADPSPYNRLAYAFALLGTENTDNYVAALEHARAAVEEAPDDPYGLMVLAFAAATNEDFDTMRQATDRMLAVAPDNPLGHYFAGMLASIDGDWAEAERELLESERLGMPAEDVREALAVARSEAGRGRLTRAGLYALGAWVVTPLLLLGAGVVFSRATLTTAYRAPAGGAFTVSRGEGALRAAYRALIAVTSAYFYISIPVVILAVVGVVGAVIYLFLMVGSIPIRLVVFLALFCLYTLYAVVRSLFTRVRETDPGRALGREDAPGLWSLAHDVARVVSTRPVDAIFAVPGTDVAVTERGGIWKKMRGTAQRYLVVGLGVLPGMTKSQMEAILAHEYGHFSNRDTAGGNLAHQVYASVNQMAFQLARTGQARWYNPAWLFVMGFLRLFLRVTLGASRLQEILADRHSALAYGAQNFASALRHIIHQDLVFRLQVETEVGQAAEGQRSLRNLYTLPSLDAEAQLQKLEEVEAKALEVPTSPYASHPAPKDRLSLLNALPTATEPTADESGPAWELLADPDGLQAEMTSIIQERVGQQAGE